MLYVFDIVNVVLTNIDFVMQMSRQFENGNEFLLDYMHYEFPIMEGTMKCEDYYRHVENMFGVRIDGDPMYDFFHPVLNEPVVKTMEDLKAMGHRVVAGTNNCVPHWRYITEKGWDKLFDKCYASHLMGCSKPFASYYGRILSSEGFRAADAMMIDDYQENIDGAARLGMKTFLYDYKTYSGNLTEDILKASV